MKCGKECGSCIYGEKPPYDDCRCDLKEGHEPPHAKLDDNGEVICQWWD